MKIRKEIFLKILWISLAILFLTSSFGIYQLVSLRSNIVAVHDAQAEVITEYKLDVMTSFNKDVVTAIALMYSEDLNNQFIAKTNQLLTIRQYLQNSYNSGVPTNTLQGDYALHITPGISFEDIEDEFRIVQSVRDKMGGVLEIDDSVWLYFASESGMMMRGRAAAPSEADFRTRYWYIGAAESGDVYWTDVYTDLRTGGLAVTISAPVYDQNGQLMGVVGSDIFLDHMVEEILNIDVDIMEFSFVLNAAGEFLFGSSPDRTLEDYVLDIRTRLALINTMLGIDSTEEIGLFTFGETIVGFSQIESNSWHVGVLVDYKRISEPIMQLSAAIAESGEHFQMYLDGGLRVSIYISVGIAAMIILISILISRTTAHSITKPIEELIHGVEKVSAGDFEHKIEVITENELKTLSEAFNSMTANIREHIETKIVLAAENQRIISELARIEIDGLTGLQGGVRYQEHRDKLGDNVARVGVAFFDVNDLKYYNDIGGHQKGDLLLKKAAESLKHINIEGTHVYRIGGDEFALFVDDCDEARMLDLLAKWQEKIAELNTADDGIRLEIAAGFAIGGVSDNLSNLLHLADERMYANKRELKEKRKMLQ